MYFRKLAYSDGPHYLLRESIKSNGFWKHRDLIDLGRDPGEFIGYPGGNAFYIKSELQETLDSAGIQYTYEDLKEILIPFLHPWLRWVFERSESRYFPYTLSRACPIDELERGQEDLHPFDVRRLLYLRFGRMDMDSVRISRSWKFLRVLSCKCRDEIEATFDAMEAELPIMEIKNYIYAAFNLQSYFPRHPLRNYPAGLSRIEVDSYFLHEITRLNLDDRFFVGVENGEGDRLHPFLSKYVGLYFEHEFEFENPWEWLMRAFMEGQQFFRESRRHAGSPKVRTSISVQEAYAVLEISHDIFLTMNRKDLIRLYRRKAKRMHPDRGGDHDAFVRLTEAYELLLPEKN